MTAPACSTFVNRLAAAVGGLAWRDVEVLGYVRDVQTPFDASRASIAPLRYGAGIKGRMGGSFACGLAVVTTAIGAEGMSLAHREHTLIAHNTEHFVAAVVELYRDPALWTRLSEQGRRHIDAHFCYVTTRPQLDAIVRNVTAGRRAIQAVGTPQTGRLQRRSADRFGSINSRRQTAARETEVAWP